MQEIRAGYSRASLRKMLPILADPLLASDPRLRGMESEKMGRFHWTQYYSLVFTIR